MKASAHAVAGKGLILPSGGNHVGFLELRRHSRAREEGMRGGSVKKVSREKEAQSGIETEAGDYGTRKALEMCSEFNKEEGG